MGQAARASEDEIVEFFTSALGVRAQQYDQSPGGAFDPEALHLARRLDQHRQAVNRYERILATLQRLGGYDRWILELAFAPRRWANSVLSVGLGGAGDGCRRNVAAVAPLTARAQRQATRSLGEDAELSHGAILRLLEKEAGKGAVALLAEVRDQAEAIITGAVEAYDVVRRIRVEGEKAAKARYYDDLANNRNAA